MNNRRDFLKFFGIGATVIPLIEGMPSTQNQAVIILPPTLEIPEPPQISLVSEMPSFGLSDAVLFLRDRQTHQVTRLDVTAFIQEARQDFIEVASWSGYRDFLPGPMHLTLTVSGKPQISTWIPGKAPPPQREALPATRCSPRDR
jgi:hypothetical protein